MILNQKRSHCLFGGGRFSNRSQRSSISNPVKYGERKREFFACWDIFIGLCYPRRQLDWDVDGAGDGILLGSASASG